MFMLPVRHKASSVLMLMAGDKKFIVYSTDNSGQIWNHHYTFLSQLISISMLIDRGRKYHHFTSCLYWPLTEGNCDTTVTILRMID